MANKYDRLTHYLRTLNSDKAETTLTFRKLEEILEFTLPRSAINYRQWWANQRDSKSRPQARAWFEAGFKVGGVRLKKPGGWVRLTRTR